MPIQYVIDPGIPSGRIAPTSNTIQKVMLVCGIASSLFYVAMNIFIPMFFKGYRSTSQTVSELSAVGAPTRALWVSLGMVYTVLITIFGLGIWRTTLQNRRLRMVGALIFIYGILNVIWPFTPMHQREVLAAGGETISDTLHLVMAGLTVLVMVLAISFGAASFGKQFRVYSIATIFTLLIFGILTALDAPKVQANLPTPYAGVWERINIGVFLLWVVILAIAAWPPKVKPEPLNKIGNSNSNSNSN